MEYININNVIFYPPYQTIVCGYNYLSYIRLLKKYLQPKVVNTFDYLKRITIYPLFKLNN